MTEGRVATHEDPHFWKDTGACDCTCEDCDLDGGAACICSECDRSCGVHVEVKP